MPAAGPSLSPGGKKISIYPCRLETRGARGAGRGGKASSDPSRALGFSLLFSRRGTGVETNGPCLPRLSFIQWDWRDRAPAAARFFTEIDPEETLLWESLTQLR